MNNISTQQQPYRSIYQEKQKQTDSSRPSTPTSIENTIRKINSDESPLPTSKNPAEHTPTRYYLDRNGNLKGKARTYEQNMAEMLRHEPYLGLTNSMRIDDQIRELPESKKRGLEISFGKHIIYIGKSKTTKYDKESLSQINEFSSDFLSESSETSSPTTLPESDDELIFGSLED